MKESTRRPQRPRLELNLPMGRQAAQETSTDTEDTEQFYAVLDRLRKAKQIIEESKEKKRRREVTDETMASFQRESKVLVNKYVKLCLERKQKVLDEGEKLRAEAVSLLEKLDRQIEAHEKFVVVHSTRLDDAGHHLQAFDLKSRREVKEMEQTSEAELDLMRTQILDKLQEVKRSLQRTAKKAKKTDKLMAMLQQLIGS